MLRRELLDVLYAGRNRNFVLVKPDSLSPPITMRDIFRIGCEFKEAGIIKDSPSDNGHGYFMRISVHGQAVWRGEAYAELEIAPPLGDEAARQPAPSNQSEEADAKSLEVEKLVPGTGVTPSNQQSSASSCFNHKQLFGCEQEFEDGTNVAAGTPFRPEDTGRVLPWYNPVEAKASSGWKDKWVTLRSRFERIIDECCPLECLLVQKRIPAYGLKRELPVILHDRHVVLSCAGLECEPSKLSTPDGTPLIGMFPIKSVRGDPMLNGQGDALAYRFGLTRQFYVQTGLGLEGDARSLPVPRLTELARDGTNLLYQLPADIALSLWRNWPSGFSKGRNSGESLWLDALFEFSWQNQPGSPLYSERKAWVANCSFGLCGNGLFPRLPDYLSSQPNSSIPHENGYPVAHHAKIEDLARASVAAIDEILERKATTIERAGAEGLKPAAPGAPASSIKDQTMNATARNKVFVSYSHKDKKLFEEFKTMLAPAIRDGIVDVWDDKRIDPGAKWKDEIQKALGSAKVGVLLVSQHFLASDFIAKHELPPLLWAAQDEGVTVFWIYFSSCLYEQTEIATYQAAHDISKPLDRLAKPHRQAVLSEVCAKLVRLAQNPM